MQKLKNIIETLRAARYLTAFIDDSGVLRDIKLLENGVSYSEQLVKHWRQTHTLDKAAAVKFREFNLDGYDPLNFRYNFTNTKEFQNGIKHLHSSVTNQDGSSVIMKSIQTVNVKKPGVDDASLKRVLLVTDFIIHPAKGLSVFYNAQRTSKIWWMRFSADPSKYFLESYNFNGAAKFEVLPGTQSVAINSKFPYAMFTVEDITCIPLNGAALESNESKNFTNVNIPGVIRSVIDLHAASGAIIFDSVDNDRQSTLMLNRKLAPYQCAVACYHEGEDVADLTDLTTHLHFVLERAGLRLLKELPVFTKSHSELDAEFEKCDNLGIPYTLIINESTLKTGLLKLRSRDTTLEETIHISDIPKYLLQIFNS